MFRITWRFLMFITAPYPAAAHEDRPNSFLFNFFFVLNSVLFFHNKFDRYVYKFAYTKIEDSPAHTHTHYSVVPQLPYFLFLRNIFSYFPYIFHFIKLLQIFFSAEQNKNKKKFCFSSLLFQLASDVISRHQFDESYK